MAVPIRDPRLQRRLTTTVAALTKRPNSSFPQALGRGAALEGAYRLLNNERIDWQELLAPHVAQTVQRVVDQGVCLAIHDSSSFMFGGEAARSDTGSLDGHGASFLGHFALAFSAAEVPRPLGILGIEAIFRPEGPRRRKQDWEVRYASADKESLRWPRMVAAVEALIDRRSSLIHLMDSEGDDFSLLTQLTHGSHRFVIRARANRALTNDQGRLHDSLATVTSVACRPVPIGGRSKAACHGRKTKHQPRDPRIAKLHMSAQHVEVKRPDHLDKLAPTSLALNVIHVYETDAPDGVEPVDWKLYSSEPIETPEQILTIVDYYRRRWLIEEYFKALKTGCAYEKRQLENRHALLNALALLAPIACGLLSLRHESRESTAATSLTPRQIEVLRAVSRPPLKAAPTARELMLAVAALGGHIKNNGDPGWLVLGRGYLDLLAYELGWAARERCDQS